jgi:hypothetical protein
VAGQDRTATPITRDGDGEDAAGSTPGRRDHPIIAATPRYSSPGGKNSIQLATIEPPSAMTEVPVM